MEYQFRGPLKEHIIGLVAEKTAIGRSYLTDMKHLYRFDKFCLAQYPDAKTLTKEIATAWLNIPSTEHSRGMNRRILPIRQLGVYMQRMGTDAYILPTNCYNKTIRHQPPHIFTPQELFRFFRAVDSVKYDHRCPARHYVLPVIFRLLYCCGLRPLEVCKLKIEDVDLDQGTCFIRETKGHKERIVAMSDDLWALCRKYRNIVQYILPCNEYFFPNRKSHYGRSHLSVLFRMCWERAGFSVEKESVPRVYDFRHTFATNRLYQWMHEGKDLHAWLPYLSTYMGHESFSDTAYYIHLVPDYYEHFPNQFDELENLIPEVEL